MENIELERLIEGKGFKSPIILPKMDEKGHRINFFKSLGEKYVLKSYIQSRKLLANSILGFQEKIYNEGFNCPLPIRVGGEFVFHNNGESYAVMRYMESSSERKPSPELIKRMSGIVATYHSHSLNKKINQQKGDVNDPYYFLSRINNSNIRMDIRPIVDLLRREVNEHDVDNKSKLGVVHGDVHKNNILINGGGIGGLIDFDNSYNGVLSRDIGELVFWSMNDLPEDFSKIIYNAYDGYNNESKIQVPLREIFNMTMLKAVSYSSWRLWEFLNRNGEENSVIESLRTIELLKSKGREIKTWI